MIPVVLSVVLFAPLAGRIRVEFGPETRGGPFGTGLHPTVGREQRSPSDFMIKIHDGNGVGLAVSNIGEFGC
jgi:hypothetical protein